MPVADPTSGRLFIWLISCFLFTSIAVGGTFLLLYIILPQNEARPWLPIAGVTLVCLPWIFWCFTCLYRIISRALGVRVVIGASGGGGSGGRGGSRVHSRSNIFNASGNVASHVPANIDSPIESAEEGDGRQVKFGGAVMLGGGDDDDDNEKKNARSLSTSISSNDLSIASQESEMPLTSDIAS
ncbi:hypothetical protein P3X46_011401 [Hevea brasiliensis]|uniref:Uncharacterized protein n=1 Tax=Hevea brasiliensis TaxID=3981 RepID=A0ABQ9M788_HEVBR|nr:uncharacterized protein LOC110634053 [Hevea brasiliensis]KAJ9176051.1 hypothetical protein P3X46_011401 [Hevea brasiliensis]